MILHTTYARTMSTCFCYNCNPPKLSRLNPPSVYFFLAHCQFTQNDHCKSILHNLPIHMDNSPTTKIINVEINVDRAETKGRTEIFFGEGRN